MHTNGHSNTHFSFLSFCFMHVSWWFLYVKDQLIVIFYCFLFCKMQFRGIQNVFKGTGK